MSPSPESPAEPVIVREWCRDTTLRWKHLLSPRLAGAMLTRCMRWILIAFVLAYFGWLEIRYVATANSLEIQLPIVTGVLLAVAIGSAWTGRRRRKWVRRWLGPTYREFLEFRPSGVTCGVRGVWHTTAAWGATQVHWAGQGICSIKLGTTTMAEPVLDLTQSEWSQIRRWIEAAHGHHRCPKCQYDMRGSSIATCPECGVRVTAYGFADVG